METMSFNCYKFVINENNNWNSLFFIQNKTDKFPNDI